MKLSVKKQRVATSELMGALIMIAITLVAGAAVFGWVNGQAGASENAYGQSVAAGSNYLREHFAPVTSTFSSCSGAPKVCTAATFWIFNNGQLSFTLASLEIQSAVGAPSFLNIIYTPIGFTAYNSGGTTISCAPSTPGFSVPGNSPIPVSTLSSAPAYAITVPSCLGVNSIVVGQGYVITMTGLYGNVVQYQVTANG
ncbi:MAG: hypothetical protein OK452_03640 [Thaumarchaeota archaeon]|nr:hypothetical protein [Nitrososphaerota archaeon]